MLKFTVSSHINSYKKTFDKLIKSLLASGVPAENIYFFIGGYDEYKKIENDKGINVYQVPHNSIDFTGLISIIELNLKSDYWFLLHDTCYVGDHFYNQIIKHNHITDTIRLTSDGYNMNMGAYKQEYLDGIRDRVLAFKNTDYSEAAVMKFKVNAIHWEDKLLVPNSPAYNNAKRIVSDGTNVYSTGVNRIKEYYPDIDIYKIKANWDLKPIYELNV